MKLNYPIRSENAMQSSNRKTGVLLNKLACILCIAFPAHLLLSVYFGTFMQSFIRNDLQFIIKLLFQLKYVLSLKQSI